MYNLTPEQLDELIRFASDNRQIASIESIEALNRLHAAVQNNVMKAYEGARKRNAMLSEALEKYKERRQEAFKAGEFTESGRDSLDVATALLYQLQQLKTYKLTDFKLNAILYEMYASWLYSKKERLFLEHPVATKFGPRFWRVFKRLSVSTAVPAQTWKIFAQNHPDVAAFCINAAKKYYDESEGTLTRMFMASKAFKNADNEHNGGKWNKEISDADIYAWKEKQKAK